MPSRLIKGGSPDAAGAQPIPFTSDGTALVRDEGVRPWPAAVATAPLRLEAARTTPAAEPALPAPDLAAVEKTAYENGFRQGEKAGMELAERKLEVVLRRYADSLVELGRLRTTLHAQVEREVVKLAIEVAKKIVHREISADREIIQTLVKIALGHVTEKSAVTVHLHPVDYNLMLERRSDLAAGGDSGREIVLLADKSIERGGCLIRTECGDIDARIEEEFREVERSFFDGGE